jgi:hypothetical protein
MQSATDCSMCGNEIIEYCGADMHTCFFMQATEQVAMPLTYVIRRKQTCVNYVYVFNLYLLYCSGVTYKINHIRELHCSGFYAMSSGNSFAMFWDNLSFPPLRVP